MSVVRKFYWDNIKYSLKLLYYSVKIYGAVIFPVFIVTALVIFLVSKISPEWSDILLLSAVTLALSLILCVLFVFLWRLIYISAYSFAKDQEESKEKWNIFYKIYKAFTNKVILASFLFLIVFLSVGFIVYSYLLPGLVVPHAFALKQGFIVGIKILLILLIILLVGGLFFLLFRALKDLKTGSASAKGGAGGIILLKVLGVAVLLVALYYCSTFIYVWLSSVLDPMLHSLFGISS